LAIWILVICAYLEFTCPPMPAQSLPFSWSQSGAQWSQISNTQPLGVGRREYWDLGFVFLGKRLLLLAICI
jgi:hypothetical protein